MNPADLLVELLRIALADAKIEPDRWAGAEWAAVFRLAVRHNVAAVAWDGLRDLPRGPERTIRLAWALEADRAEAEYDRKRKAAAALCGELSGCGFRVMLLKGLGTSACYPVPAHRSFEDVDIWCFGRSDEVDRFVGRKWGVRIVRTVSHHTSFVFCGVTFENHRAFFNTASHASNREFDRELHRLIATPGAAFRPAADLAADIPPVEFDALFLLRHLAVHFAGSGICLRHLVDWMAFLQREGRKIDGERWLETVRRQRMDRFAGALTDVLVRRLGFDGRCFPALVRLPHDERLADRIFAEVLDPRFESTPPVRGFLSVVRWKIKRYRSGVWKRRLVYREGPLSMLIRQLWAHLRTPRSILR